MIEPCDSGKNVSITKPNEQTCRCCVKQDATESTESRYYNVVL